MPIAIQFRKNMKKIINLFLMIITIVFVYSKVYAVSDRLNIVKRDNIISGCKICKSPLLVEFYKKRDYKLAWVKDGKLTKGGSSLVNMIQNSIDDGLDPSVYHIRQINNLVKQLNVSSDGDLFKTSANLDVILSDGMLLYMNNLAYGLYNGKKLYPTWPIAKKDYNLLKVAESSANSEDVSPIILSVAPKYSGYLGLRDKLDDYYKIASAGGWDAIPDGDTLKYGDRNERVQFLQDRLLDGGELTEIDNYGKFDKDTQKALITFQKNHGLDPDGNVGAATLRALNVPVATRIRQIELNMDRMRYLPDEFPSRYIMVNVPGYYLQIFDESNPVINSPVVVGQPPKHKTCILDSEINTIEVNPYWNIPSSIAAQDLLPQIKEDKSYLASTDTRVFKKTKGVYQEVDPSSVDWEHVESKDLLDLTYKFRQNPGSENQLGVLKFIFPNNCGIYLHDSLYTELFDDTNRGLSHGCVRVGDPLLVATFLLEKNKDLGSSDIKAKINSKKHEFIKIITPVKLYIIYLTAWYESGSDSVQFRDDIYGNDKISLYPLYLPKIKHQNSDDKQK